MPEDDVMDALSRTHEIRQARVVRHRRELRTSAVFFVLLGLILGFMSATLVWFLQ